MTSSLVGSEMCIRDSRNMLQGDVGDTELVLTLQAKAPRTPKPTANASPTVSYTHLTLPTICSV
eukprot:248549-Prorocentrum_lima.AAC.1